MIPYPFVNGALCRAEAEVVGTRRQMENYSKGRNVEEPLTKESIPIPCLPPDFTWMQVRGGSNVHGLLEVALKSIKANKAVVWSGSGGAVNKTISCAEIMKRKEPDLHQITRVCFRKTEEYWEPIRPELSELVVERKEPAVHILLSNERLPTDIPGYQAPGECDAFWKAEMSSRENKRKNFAKRKTDGPFMKKLAEIGLRTSQK